MEQITTQFTDICNMLPTYCLDYFTARDTSFQLKTKLAYAMDLRIFFEYLLKELPEQFPYDTIADIPLESLDKLTPRNIDQYLLYLKNYETNGKTYSNSEAGVKRKLAALKSFFKHFVRYEKLSSSPCAYVYTPKVAEKEIVVLSDDEKRRLRDAVSSGSRKSERAKVFHQKTVLRDTAILSLFLGTGIRVSELVGINDYDLDIAEQSIFVTRKGGKRELVYFNKDVLSDLLDYIDSERSQLLGLTEEEMNESIPEDGPLFVSLKKQRISVRRVETIIKDYAKFVMPASKKVTPHVLRKTFGTELYSQYRDLYLTQKALGHSSPATTERFYAKFSPEYMKKMKDFNPNNDK